MNTLHYFFELLSNCSVWIGFEVKLDVSDPAFSILQLHTPQLAALLFAPSI